MKKLINISQKWRKLTAILLLLNFAAAPLIYAFPEEECNAACEIDALIHECHPDAANQIEDTCCDMMEMYSTTNSSDSAECEMELSDINCALVYQEQANESYVLPKTIDNKVDLIILPMFSVDEDNSLVLITNYSHEMFIDSSPPIYLMISSFLN